MGIFMQSNSRIDWLDKIVTQCIDQSHISAMYLYFDQSHISAMYLYFDQHWWQQQT